jgi:hypothetical protein
MLYTLIGGIVGFFLTRFLYGGLFYKSKTSGYVIDKGDVLTFIGVIFGAGVGFGYGSYLLGTGGHFYNRIFNFFV